MATGCPKSPRRSRLDAAQAAPAGGLVDTLVAARARGGLAADEATAMLLQLVIAGTESTTSLLGSAVRLLAGRPDLQDRLRDAHLARLEAVVALRLLLSATSDLTQSAGTAPAYVPSLFVRRLARLPIEVNGARTGG
ncbi:hypothetical protein [Streptomyces sp. NPDC046371]|uniref:hypothetical protein n=2 Tax=Streptomyces TaxID=1883 RepID=UPI0033C1A79D